jgi:hypothetical protein
MNPSVESLGNSVSFLSRYGTATAQDCFREFEGRSGAVWISTEGINMKQPTERQAVFFPLWIG